MNNKFYGWFFLSFISVIAGADEERSSLAFAALPEAARTTVTRFIDQGDITKIEKVTDKDYVKFEIKSTKTVNNKDFIDTDMIVAADGAIIKMAKEVPFFDIPFPIMKILNQQYPDLKVDEVENVQTRYFQLTGKNNGQPVNIKIFDDGEIQTVAADNKVKMGKQPAGPVKQQNSKRLTQNPGASSSQQNQDDAYPKDPSDDIFHLNPGQ